MVCHPWLCKTWMVGCCTCARYICGSSRPGVEPEQLPQLAGVALLCAAPGTGNDALVPRIARKSFLKAAKLTWRALQCPPCMAACARPAVHHEPHGAAHHEQKVAHGVRLTGAACAGRW